MAVKGLLLDRDGTIIDLHAPFLRMIRKSAALFADGDEALEDALLRAANCTRQGGRLSLASMFAAGTDADIVAVWGPLLPRHSSTALIGKIEEIGAPAIAEAAAIAGVVDAILHLRQSGFVLGIATNASCASAQATVARLGLSSAMAFVAGADSGYGAKPGAGMATAFCAATGLAPGQVAIVGDTPHDIGTGRSAGLGWCIGVLSGAGSSQDLSDADHILDSLAELPTVLTRQAWR